MDKVRRNVLIFGIASIIFSFLLSPAGLVLGIFGYKEGKHRGNKSILPLIGIILSSLILLYEIVIIVLAVGFGRKIQSK